MDAALFQEPRRRMIPLKDGEMAALDFGDASRPVDVVFLHANGFNAMTYRSILAPLSLSLRIVALDQRGHGLSRLPADPRGRRSWADFRDDLLAALQALGGGPMVLSGHSMGATVALLAAGDRPEAAKSLVLFEPVILSRWASFYARAPWASGALRRRMTLARNAERRRRIFDSAAEAFASYRGRGAFKTWPETMLADYVSAGFRTRPDGCVELACPPAWEASNYAAQANNPWAAFRKLEAPVSVYRGEHHSTCRLGSGPRVGGRGGELQLYTVAGTSHFLPMERPDVVRDALLDAAGV
jgi:pimeloyl-ACP methyl ester carboxylesterase